MTDDVPCRTLVVDHRPGEADRPGKADRRAQGREDRRERNVQLVSRAVPPFADTAREFIFKVFLHVYKEHSRF